jgi:hypothetical protein
VPSLSLFLSLFLEEGIEEACKLLLGALRGSLGSEPRLQLLDLPQHSMQRSVLGPRLSISLTHYRSLLVSLSVRILVSTKVLCDCLDQTTEIQGLRVSHHCKCLTSALQAASMSFLCFLVLPLIFSCFSLISLPTSSKFGAFRNCESDLGKSTRGSHEERS